MNEYIKHIIHKIKSFVRKVLCFAVPSFEGVGEVVVLFVFISCQPDIPMVNLGIDEVYKVERMKALVLHPEFPGERYEWTMPAADGTDSLVSTERDFIFCKADTGTYRLHLQIVDAKNPVQQDILIAVWEEQVSYSRYISTVYDFFPAPGQFVNVLPAYEEGNTAADMVQKVQDAISGTNDVLISLGGFGGYVTFGFDHSVVNIPGEYDFKILGNAFYADANPHPEKGKGGSCEPGIVEVSFDRNQNGIPDDEWYELAGSAYRHADTRHHYSITYFRPDTAKEATPKKGTPLTDTTYIAWHDNYGDSGYVVKNVYHKQDYYPKWISQDSLTLSGTCLPPNGFDESGVGNYYVLYAFDWGYVDNQPNDSTDLISFNIEWAVDADGNSVYLPCIDFVRVYTAENQSCGWIGETSTELSRAEDLHIPEKQW